MLEFYLFLRLSFILSFIFSPFHSFCEVCRELLSGEIFSFHKLFSYSGDILFFVLWSSFRELQSSLSPTSYFAIFSYSNFYLHKSCSVFFWPNNHCVNLIRWYHQSLATYINDILYEQISLKFLRTRMENTKCKFMHMPNCSTCYTTERCCCGQIDKERREKIKRYMLNIEWNLIVSLHIKGKK